MEMQLLLLPFVAALISIALWGLTSLPATTSRRRRRLPPGTMGWPIIGETFRFYHSHTTARPHSFYEERTRRYGSLFRTHLFLSPTVVSTDPHLNKLLLLNEGKLVESKYPAPFITLFGPYTLLNLHGTLHKKLHGAAVSLLSGASLKLHFVEDIESYVLRTLRSWAGRSVVRAEEDIKHFSLSLIAKQLLGLEPGQETQMLTMDCVDLLKAGLSIPFNAPWTVYGRGLKARKRIINKLREVIQKRRREADVDVEYTDILGKLMSWEDLKLTDEQIMDFLLFLILAGHETTAMTISCAIKFLAECPQAVQELREEYDAFKTANIVTEERLTWNGYKEMVFTKKVINETLRLTNVPTAIMRRAKQDVELEGYTIPKGWCVMVPILALHLNEDAYPNAFKFDPWRWKDTGETSHPSFMPFGAGARLCAGSELGKLEASIFLYHLISKFKWEIVEDSPLSWFPLPNFPNHLPIRLTRR